MHELNLLTEQNDTAWQSIVVSVAVFKSVGTLQNKVSVIVSHQPKIFDGDRVVEELHSILMALGAGMLDCDLMGTGAFEPEPK
jgi:hypothetical protein